MWPAGDCLNRRRPDAAHSQMCLQVAWLYGWNGIPDLSPLNGTLRSDTLTKYKLHGPQRGYNVSDLATRANDGEEDNPGCDM